MSKAVKYRILKYLIGSILCIIINFIYSLFGHGVHSNYMTYMFIIPLFLGPTSVLANIYDNKEARDFAFCGIVTLVIGFFIKGVFEIAGTSSPFQGVFFYVGCILYMISIVWTIKHQ